MARVVKGSIETASSSKSLHAFIKANDGGVLMINGVKGGVSKSMMTLLMLHIYGEYANNDVELIELDFSNDDCGKIAVANGIDFQAYDGKSRVAWEAINEAVHEKKHKIIVVNFPAQIEGEFREYGADVVQAAHDAGVGIATIWCLGPFRDSTKALRRYLELGTGEPVFVAKTLFAVDVEADFEVWNKTRDSLDLRGGNEFNILKAPFRLRARAFDGLESEIDGKIERWSIARYIAENRKSYAGTSYASGAERWIEDMKREIGVIASNGGSRED